MKFFIVIIALLLSETAFAQKATKPNIVIVYFDDTGYGDTEPYGMTGIHTPNFNRLAQERLRLTNFNTVQGVCTASRAALHTGAYANRLGLSGTMAAPNSKIALNPEEEKIASLLRRKGYVTGMLRKWYLGSKPPYFPLSYGFDSFYGLPYFHDISPMQNKRLSSQLQQLLKQAGADSDKMSLDKGIKSENCRNDRYDEQYYEL